MQKEGEGYCHGVYILGAIELGELVYIERERQMERLTHIGSEGQRCV
jgi:hypothetical protein